MGFRGMSPDGKRKGKQNEDPFAEKGYILSRKLMSL